MITGKFLFSMVPRERRFRLILPDTLLCHSSTDGHSVFLSGVVCGWDVVELEPEGRGLGTLFQGNKFGRS